MSGPAPSQLDANQVLQHAFDDATGRLRVDAAVSASINAVKIEDEDGDVLEINPDGSLNTNIQGDVSLELSAADGDNVAISDGTNTLSVNANGSINIEAIDLDIRNLTFAQDKVDVTGSSVEVSSVDLDIRDLKFSQDSVDVTGSVVTEEFSSDILAELQSIDNKLPALGLQDQANSISVTVASDQPAINVDVELDAFTSPEPDNVQLVGSIDGTKTGQKFGIVSNLRLQILDAHDRIAQFTYADFGTKNQRVTQIDYSSATFPGTTVRRVFNYTLVGNSYRRDDELWLLI